MSCASTFSPDLLEEAHVHRPEEDGLTRALRRAAGAVLAAGGTMTAEQRREAVIVLQRYASVPYNSRDLEHDVAAAVDHPIDEELKPLAWSLNDHSRNAVIDATAQLATRVDAATEQRVVALRAVAAELTFACDRARDSVADRLERALVGA